MITQQEKDVKAADKEDADKEDVEETKKAQKKFRQIATAYFKFIEKELSCLTHERNQPRIFCQIIRKPLKQNKIQHHAIKTMNIKSFLT